MNQFQHAEESQYWSNTANFIFISIRNEIKSMVSIATFLMTTRCYNSILIGIDQKTFKIFTTNPFDQRRNWFFEMHRNLSFDTAFPDRQKNLNGYTYKVLFRNNYPKLFLRNDIVQGSTMDFLKALAVHQNAKLALTYVDIGEKGLKTFYNYFSRSDLCPNTDLFFRSKTPGAIRQVETFETGGYCAMLPNPERTSFFSYVMKPFDTWVWLLSALATIMFAVILRYLNRNFSIVTYIMHFFGENLTFPERRLIEKAILLMKYFLVFIVSLGYESFIISYMANSRNGERIKTVNELISSNFSFMADNAFKVSNFYPELSEKIIGTFDNASGLNFSKTASEKIGLIMACNMVDLFYQSTEEFVKVDKTAIDHYYRLPEKLLTYFMRFPTATFSPFTDRIQEFSLKVFQAGLRQHWSSMIDNEDMKAVRDREAIVSGDYLMKLGDIAGAFYLLGLGLLLAAFSLVLEVIWGYGNEIFWFFP